MASDSIADGADKEGLLEASSAAREGVVTWTLGKDEPTKHNVHKRTLYHAVTRVSVVIKA